MIRRLLAWLGAPPADTGMCGCGCPADTHRHWRPGTDCGHCGRDLCPAFERVDLTDVCRDQQVIAAIEAGDLDYARTIAPPEFVQLMQQLVALREER